MKKLVIAYLVLVNIALASTAGVLLYRGQIEPLFGAPVSNVFRNIMPATDTTYEVGTTTLRWKKLWVTDIDMSGTFTGTVSSASSTLLTDSNTFSGINLFTNASSNFDGTWQNLSPSAFAQFSYLFPNNATSTTLTFSGGLVSSASTTFSQLGTGLTGSNNGLLYGNIATTTASCSGTLACTSFAILGSSPITLTGSDTTIIPVSTSSVP